MQAAVLMVMFGQFLPLSNAESLVQGMIKDDISISRDATLTLMLLESDPEGNAERIKRVERRLANNARRFSAMGEEMKLTADQVHAKYYARFDKVDHLESVDWKVAPMRRPVAAELPSRIEITQAKNQTTILKHSIGDPKLDVAYEVCPDIPLTPGTRLKIKLRFNGSPASREPFVPSLGVRVATGHAMPMFSPTRHPQPETKFELYLERVGDVVNGVAIESFPSINPDNERVRIRSVRLQYLPEWDDEHALYFYCRVHHEATVTVEELAVDRSSTKRKARR